MGDQRSEDVFRRREHCPVCEGRDAATLYEEDFSEGETRAFLARYYQGRVPAEVLRGVPFRLLQCAECRFIWQEFVLADAWSVELYETWISPLESLGKERMQKRAADANRRAQIALIGFLMAPDAPRNARVLDFGMGWGSWCRLAAEAGFEAFGLELSPSRIAHAEGLGLRVLRDLGSWDGAFAYVNAEQVLEHIVDPGQVLGTMRRILRPNGLVRIGVPDGRKFLRRHRRGVWRPSKDQVHPLEHINCFTPATLKRLARRAGFEPVPPARFAGALVLQLVTGRASPAMVAKSLYLQFFGTGIVFRRTAPATPPA